MAENGIAETLFCAHAGMRITTDTKYSEFKRIEKYASDLSLAEIKAAAQRVFVAYNELTIDGFWGCLNGDFSLLGDMTEPTVLQIYWLLGFEQFCKDVSALLERLKLPTDPNKVAMYDKGCVEMTPQESMLVFVREYFALPSFYAAGRRTIGEYLTARKDTFNRDMQKYNFNKHQEAKLKAKK